MTSTDSSGKPSGAPAALPAGLPAPTPDAQAHSERLRAHIQHVIRAAGGWIPFEHFMTLALHAPGLGYYAAGATKLGAAGDFTTAPELTPLFARTLACQVEQLLVACDAPCVLEAGAGSGALAADLLLTLEAGGRLPDAYLILEVSADLRQRQRDTLAHSAPHLLARVRWLDELPQRYSGVVLANEVLDAMPVQLVVWTAQGIGERGVGLDDDGGLRWEDRSAAVELAATAVALGPTVPYLSEVNRQAEAWVRAWGDRLERGALLIIDYGFPGREYYHPQRNTGTLMCHYRHRAHTDPLILPGLQDITAHVDFSAIAAAGLSAGLDVLGYTSQGQFLLNAGLTDVLAACGPADSVEYLRAARHAAQLVSPAEMGELFKVIVLGRGVGLAADEPLLGFTAGDRSHAL